MIVNFEINEEEIWANENGQVVIKDFIGDIIYYFIKGHPENVFFLSSYKFVSHYNKVEEEKKPKIEIYSLWKHKDTHNLALAAKIFDSGHVEMVSYSSNCTIPPCWTISNKNLLNFYEQIPEQERVSEYKRVDENNPNHKNLQKLDPEGSESKFQWYDKFVLTSKIPCIDIEEVILNREDIWVRVSQTGNSVDAIVLSLVDKLIKCRKTFNKHLNLKHFNRGGK